MGLVTVRSSAGEFSSVPSRRIDTGVWRGGDELPTIQTRLVTMPSRWASKSEKREASALLTNASCCRVLRYRKRHVRGPALLETLLDCIDGGRRSADVYLPHAFAMAEAHVICQAICTLRRHFTH